MAVLIVGNEKKEFFRICYENVDNSFFLTEYYDEKDNWTPCKIVRRKLKYILYL